MNMRVNTRLIVVLVLVLAIFMSFSVGIAQDEGGDTSTEPAGVGEIAKAADNFDVSGVPTQEQVKTVVNAPPVLSAAANFNVEARMRAEGKEIFSDKLEAEPPDLDRNAKFTPPGQTPWEDVLVQADDTSGDVLSAFTDYSVVALDAKRAAFFQGHLPDVDQSATQTPSGDVLMQIDDASGDVLTVFTDYSVVAAHANGEIFFQGHLAGQSAASLMIVGKNTQGTQYALSHGDVIGMTASGDVYFRIDKHWYLYDYNESGDFVGLTDGDGHKYDVETAANGDTTITDPAGDIGDFNPDGSYDIKNPAGDVLDQGALFGENDGDVTLTPDAEATEGSPDANSSAEADATIAPDNGGDAGSLNANSADEANATLAPDNGEATESSDASSGDTTGEG